MGNDNYIEQWMLNGESETDNSDDDQCLLSQMRQMNKDIKKTNRLVKTKLKQISESLDESLEFNKLCAKVFNTSNANELNIVDIAKESVALDYAKKLN